MIGEEPDEVLADESRGAENAYFVFPLCFFGMGAFIARNARVGVPDRLFPPATIETHKGCSLLSRDRMRSLGSARRHWGAQKKKPTAGFASGGGLETFSSLLDVSPRARGGSSRRSRSRSCRHGRRGANSGHGDGDHTDKYASTHE